MGKNIFVTILVILAAVALALVVYENVYKSTDPFSSSQKKLLENYIKENISALSPVKEVLGGKFYVTDIKWQNDGSMLVKYEDGHIALEALVKASINRDNQIKIQHFNIIKQ